MRLFGALLRHERIGVLRRCARRDHGQEDSGEQNRPSNFPRYPHRTAPPFTLTTSPVIKVARSDARNRMGPAISSADRKSTRLNSSHSQISYAVFCLKKKKTQKAT